MRLPPFEQPPSLCYLRWQGPGAPVPCQGKPGVPPEKIRALAAAASRESGLAGRGIIAVMHAYDISYTVYIYIYIYISSMYMYILHVHKYTYTCIYIYTYVYTYAYTFMRA